MEQINKNYQQYNFQPISVENNENSSNSVNTFTEKMNNKINELRKEELIVVNRANEEIGKKEGILETVKTELQVFVYIWLHFDSKKRNSCFHSMFIVFNDWNYHWTALGLFLFIFLHDRCIYYYMFSLHFNYYLNLNS